jgi:hypothetical protein
VTTARALAWVALGAAVAALGAGWLWLRRHDQVPDPSFDPGVAHPAYDRRHPRVCVDEAHHNQSTITGRYAPFARLLRSDGYDVAPLRVSFDAGAFARCEILVIVNALGSRFPFLKGAADPAFSDSEVAAVVAWVETGGALLLVADHHPAGAAARSLASGFGVELSTGLTYDDPHSDWSSGSPSWLVFQPDSGGLLLPHPITVGRDATERLQRVVTFTGESLRGPPGSVGFLALAATAEDRLPSGLVRSAAGRSQAVALLRGRGRVVVAGEAAMLTAQVTGAGSRPFGMNRPGSDDRQLALNLLHWLSGLLPES